ncbi:MAG: hypothetical protein ACREJO_14065 [Phycisphaerales bacterium]
MAESPATTSKKRPGRKRRVAGWVLLAFGVLVTGVWGASRWWEFGYFGTTWNVEAVHGQWHVTGWTPEKRITTWWGGRSVPVEDQGWTWWQHIEFLDTETRWWAIAGVVGAGATWTPGGGSGRTWWLIVLPWPFALASLLGGGWLVWSGRRARKRAMTGMCLNCGYDLRGLAAGVPCPECGGAGRAERRCSLQVAARLWEVTPADKRPTPRRRRRGAGAPTAELVPGHPPATPRAAWGWGARPEGLAPRSPP